MRLFDACYFQTNDNLRLLVSNDSAENGCGADETVVGTAGGGNGAVNKGDDPYGTPGAVCAGGVGRFNDEPCMLDAGNEDALEIGGHADGGGTRLVVFGYARLEIGYVFADETIEAPRAVL